MPRSSSRTPTGTAVPEPDPTKADSTHKYNIEETIGGPTSPSTEPATAITTEAPPPESIQMRNPYQEMLKREYDYAVDQQIRKGIQALNERFTRLYSQERNPTDTSPHDNLGNTSDYYERIINAYQSGNWQALAPTIEELYAMLFDLRFTEMRNIEAIKQEYNQS